MPTRVVVLALAPLLLGPLAAATHPVDADPATLAREGGEIVLSIEVSGDYQGSSTAREEWNGGEDFHETSATVRGSYAWAATAFLQPAAADAGWTHADRAYANITASHRFTTASENAQSVGEEYEVHGYGESDCIGSGVQPARPKVLGRIDEAKRAVVLRFEDMQLFSPTSLAWECGGTDTGYDGTVTPREVWSPSYIPGAPLVKDAIAAAPAGRELQEVAHLTLEVPLDAPKQILVGNVQGGFSDGDRRDPTFYYCGASPYEPVGSCRAQGVVTVQVWVNPCNAARASYERHLADVKALVPPANGSSESQVRAFTVDAGQRIRALLADARALELACPDAPEGTLTAVAGLQGKVSAAWADVEKTHGLSRDGLRDALAAERAAQLVGAEGVGDVSPYIAAIERYQGAPGSTQKGSVGTHSPVSIHVWDEQGRHVGWNTTKGAPDVDVEGAVYEGAPGDAQTLTLPPGVYRFLAEEVAVGTYTLNVTIANESDLMPLRAAPGGSSSMTLLVDDTGGLALAAARGVSTPGWLAPSALEDARQAASTPERARTEGDAKAVPPAALALALGALALVARLRRRG